MKNVLRQGDVCLIAVDEIPEGATVQPPTGRKLVLAFGEVTGHHHRFEFLDTSHNAKLYVAASGARYLHVTAPIGLDHEEHDTVPAKLTVGKWLLPQQVEYAPAALRNVAD